MKRAIALSLAVVLVSFLVPTAGHSEADSRLSLGRTVYLSLYSHVLIGGGRKPLEINMSTLLSIRNTDRTNQITVSSIEYFNTGGEKIRDFIDKPLTLKAMATHELFVGTDDMTGGSGANFLIEWKSAKPVSPPIIEGLHCSWRGQLGISFITTGKVVKDNSH